MLCAFNISKPSLKPPRSGLDVSLTCRGLNESTALSAFFTNSKSHGGILSTGAGVNPVNPKTGTAQRVAAVFLTNSLLSIVIKSCFQDKGEIEAGLLL